MKLEPLTDYSVYKVMCENILNKYSSENFVTINARPLLFAALVKAKI